jgi:hypothetical protein
MQNQAAVEALYSATFVEDYLDCVENLPNDLQRHLSRNRFLWMSISAENFSDQILILNLGRNSTQMQRIWISKTIYSQ